MSNLTFEQRCVIFVRALAVYSDPDGGTMGLTGTDACEWVDQAAELLKLEDTV